MRALSLCSQHFSLVPFVFFGSCYVAGTRRILFGCYCWICSIHFHTFWMCFCVRILQSKLLSTTIINGDMSFNAMRCGIRRAHTHTHSTHIDWQTSRQLDRQTETNLKFDQWQTQSQQQQKISSHRRMTRKIPYHSNCWTSTLCLSAYIFSHYQCHRQITRVNLRLHTHRGTHTNAI